MRVAACLAASELQETRASRRKRRRLPRSRQPDLLCDVLFVVVVVGGGGGGGGRGHGGGGGAAAAAAVVLFLWSSSSSLPLLVSFSVVRQRHLTLTMCVALCPSF